ncbi:MULTISPECIES: oligosaccharide repeat unit polymerase [Aliivibrio]|uniref:oligosaccharide repeat unit polymerase n=1 Tax=Aliivibrio TaxID=511678 RepID=UPI002378FF04|nr:MULTISPECIES: oligosaccharide repeat unit polymerase [Aliivibrio]MDD9179631.1 oligosaccharide repeat unit polymerase [Aliivibrio sp. A6]
MSSNVKRLNRNSLFKKSTIFIFSMFLILTLLSEYIGFMTKKVGGDLISLNLDFDFNRSLLIYVMYFSLTVACFLFVIYWSKIITPLVIVSSNGTLIHLVFLLIAIFYFVSINIFGVGSIVDGRVNSRLVELVYALLQPVFLLPIYFLYFFGRGKLLYLFSLFIYIIAVLFSGFSNYFILILPLFLSVFFKCGRIFQFGFVVLGFLLLPLLRIVKYCFVHNQSFNYFISMLTFDNLIAFGRVMVDRFSYLHNVQYMMGNASQFLSSYESLSLHPFFSNYIGSKIYSAFINDPNAVGNINNLYNYIILGSWGSNTYAPLLSQMLIDPLGAIVVFIFYVFIFMFVSLLLSFISAERWLRVYLTIVPLILYCLPGFYWAYMNLIQSIVLFFLIVVLFKALSVLFNIKTLRKPERLSEV